MVLLALEIRYLPVLSYLDSRRYVGLVRGDDEPPGVRRVGHEPPPGPSEPSG